MNKILAGALFAAVTAVGACSGLEKKVDKTNPAPCPNVVVLDDAARIIEFVGEERLEDVAYTGEITGISSTCQLVVAYGARVGSGRPQNTVTS